MLQKDMIIKNKRGLHARPAAVFVDIASRFAADIKLIFEDTTINAKSIIGVLSLGLGEGDLITLIFEGPDEEEALTTLVELINNNFNEIR